MCHGGSLVGKHVIPVSSKFIDGDVGIHTASSPTIRKEDYADESMSHYNLDKKTTLNSTRHRYQEAIHLVEKHY